MSHSNRNFTCIFVLSLSWESNVDMETCIIVCYVNIPYPLFHFEYTIALLGVTAINNFNYKIYKIIRLGASQTSCRMLIRPQGYCVQTDEYGGRTDTFLLAVDVLTSPA